MLLACLDSPHGLSDATVAKEMNRHRSSDRARTAGRQPSRVVTGVAISRRIRTFYYTYILQTDAKKDCYERVSDSLHAAWGPTPQFAAHAPPLTRPELHNVLGVHRTRDAQSDAKIVRMPFLRKIPVSALRSVH